MDITQILIGLVVGIVITSLAFTIVMLVKSGKAKKRADEVELIAKSIGLFMSESNGAFTSYRLGDIDFAQLESKVRSLVEKINEEVNNSIDVLDSTYVSIIGKYAEDKIESILTLREMQSSTDRSSVNRSTNVESINEFDDFAATIGNSVASSSLVGDEHTMVDPLATSNQDIFGEEQTIVAQSISQQAPVQPQQPSSFEQQAPVQPQQPSFVEQQIPTQQQQPAFEQQPMSQSFEQQAPIQQQVQSQQPQFVEQPQFEQQVSNNDPFLADPFGNNATVGVGDVEATQEFSVSDIMSGADSNPQKKQDDMVTGSDVADKLDSFFDF